MIDSKAESEKLDSYFKNLQVSVNSLKNGIKVNLLSNDEKLVSKLQTSGTTPIFRYLHNDVFNGHHGMRYHHGGQPQSYHWNQDHMDYGPGVM